MNEDTTHIITIHGRDSHQEIYDPQTSYRQYLQFPFMEQPHNYPTHVTDDT